MMPMTPIGTRMRPTCIPLGRRHIFVTSPTGSGSAATSRRPTAISLMRLVFSVSRSIAAFEMPLAAVRSFLLAASSSASRASRASAMASRALFFTAVDGVAALEVSVHRRDAGREEALALARKGLDRAVVQREAALGLHRVADPVLAARELLALRQEDGPDRIPLEQPRQVARALPADD